MVAPFLLPRYSFLNYSQIMNIAEIEHNPLLFGHDTRTGIVSVEPAGHFVRVFYRTGSAVHFHDEPFQPFILSLIHI